jgi:hypothetical protein
VSQRDVPGWSRATIPLLAKRGIQGLSFGAGTPPGKPDTPALFVWKDLPSGTDVVTTYESKYGDISTVFVLPNGVAMAAAWSGDNTGPGSLADFLNDTATLQARFPAAKILSSTFDAFFAIANQKQVKAQLPVVTQEIGDGWLYGVPSDPLKNAMFREVDRQRAVCIGSGRCDAASGGMRAFDRLLVKVPEHTWGIAGQIFMGDYANWANSQFDLARAAVPGFSNSSTDYNTTAESWREQRTFITDAPRLLVSEQPALAASLVSALEDLRDVQPPSTEHLSAVADPTTRHQCGGLQVGFDARGAMSTLVSGSTVLANASHPLGLFEYQTFDNEDYNTFLSDFTVRVNGSAYRACPAHYVSGAPDDSGCRNFRKPNVSSASPVRRALHPTLTKLWAHTSASGGDASAGVACTFVAELGMDAEAHELAGAPEKLVVQVNVSSSGTISWDVVQVNKRPTRLPEAEFFSFTPAIAATQPEGWRLQVLGSQMDPTDVLGSGGAASGSVYGGSPHLRGVDSVGWSAASHRGFTISSLDVPVVSTGKANPFPTPRTSPPDMSLGVHYNIQNNLWNTNYVLWYPFNAEDNHIRSRFEMRMH